MNEQGMKTQVAGKHYTELATFHRDKWNGDILWQSPPDPPTRRALG